MKKYTKDELIKKAYHLHAIAQYCKNPHNNEALATLGKVLEALNTKANKWSSMNEQFEGIQMTAKYLTSDKVKSVVKN